MKKIKTIKIKNCKFNFKNIESHCFMYDFKKLGVTQKQLAQSFEGAKLIVFKNEKLKMSNAMRKCIYCGKNCDNLTKHLKKKHDKKPKDIVLAKFQLELYRELLRLQRERDTVSAFVFTVEGCKLCVDPVKEGREGLCSVPESARNKVRSLKYLGFKCQGFNSKWFENDRYGFVIIQAEKAARSIPSR